MKPLWLTMMAAGAILATFSVTVITWPLGMLLGVGCITGSVYRLLLGGDDVGDQGL